MRTLQMKKETMPAMTYARFKTMCNLALISSDEESVITEPLLDEEGAPIFDSNGEPVQTVKEVIYIEHKLPWVKHEVQSLFKQLDESNIKHCTTRGNEMRRRRCKGLESERPPPNILLPQFKHLAPFISQL